MVALHACMELLLALCDMFFCFKQILHFSRSPSYTNLIVKYDNFRLINIELLWSMLQILGAIFPYLHTRYGINWSSYCGRCWDAVSPQIIMTGREYVPVEQTLSPLGLSSLNAAMSQHACARVNILWITMFETYELNTQVESETDK